MKKLVCLVLALLMVLSLAACAPKSAVSEAAGKRDSKYRQAIEVSMNVMNAEKNGQHARNEFVKEKFNLTFEYIPVSWGDWNEKIRTWVATDDAPDLIWWDLKGAQAQEFYGWAQQGAFAPFKAEYFTADRPNLTETYNSSPSVAALSYDGNLYAWPSLRDNPPEAQSCYTSHWCYRRDWAQAVGLYQEGDIYTWEQWLELLRAIVAQDPGGNGTANAALVMPTWAFPHAPALFIGPPAAEGNETCSYIKVDGQYVWPPALEEYRAGVKVTYDMYQENLIYKDNILFTGNEHESLIKSGLAFANYNVTGSLNTWTTDMIKDGVIDEREDFGIAIVQGWDGNWYMTQTEDYWTVTAMSHNIEEDQINRVLDFWEWLQTDDGVRLRNYGIEGIDFNRTGDGLTDFELTWEFDDATGTYVSPYANDEFNEANGSENGRTVLGPGTVMYQYEERDRLWNTFASGSIPTVVKGFDLDVSFMSAENKDKYGSFGSEVKAKMIELIAQPGIDIEAEWDAYIETMMPRVQLVLDELNAG